MRRRAVLLVAILASTSLSGCLGVNLGAWWDREGIVRVHLAPVGPEASDVEAFRSLTLTVWSVGLGIAQTDARTGGDFKGQWEYVFDPPLRIEFVGNATEGVEIPLLETRAPLRAVRDVTLRVTVNESRLVGGRAIEGCFEGIPHDPPCVRVAQGGIYPITEPNFSPRRGETVTFVAPMGVHFSTSSGEYFMRAETGKLRYE